MGPLLFSVFNNDLLSAVNSKSISMYTDDATSYHANMVFHSSTNQEWRLKSSCVKSNCNLILKMPFHKDTLRKRLGGNPRKSEAQGKVKVVSLEWSYHRQPETLLNSLKHNLCCYSKTIGHKQERNNWPLLLSYEIIAGLLWQRNWGMCPPGELIFISLTWQRLHHPL